MTVRMRIALVAGLIGATTVLVGGSHSGAPGGSASAQPIIGLFPTTTSTTVLEQSVPEKGLGVGDRGEPVRMAERMLDNRRYHVGKVDEVFDENTAYAVTAFQKVHGMDRTGRLTREVAARLRRSTTPLALVPAGGSTRVEVDLPRQVLFFVERDAVTKVLPVSTGTGKRYCEDGQCGVADTPPGAYRVAYRVSGWQKSRLGRLYNPVYFDTRQGLAIHGFPRVPAHPASHGCVRIPMSAAEWFPNLVPNGTPVYVLDGKTPVAPMPLA